MRRQRNNIATKVPFEQRRIINRMLVDGFAYAQISAELQRQFPGAPKLHGSTLQAWQKSPEFVRYRTAREADREELETTAAQAAALNDGRGPESSADVICMEVLRELHKQIRGGQITELGDLASVTQALAPLMRAQIARDLADAKNREVSLKADIEALKEEHIRELAERDAENEELQAEITRIKTEAEEKLAKLTSGRQITPEVIAQIKQIYGIKAEAPKPA